ncbi:MAG: DUF4040 domain-containing protein [Rickettsiaceae bacterium]|nr:DUF4040 domain-containing protein [Rickettsiaceae bacterium]
MRKLELLPSYSAIFFLSVLCLACLFLCLAFWRSRDGVSKIINLSALSSVICIIYLILDAPDVALTEASINAVISTAILLAMNSKIITQSYPAPKLNFILGLVCAILVFTITFYLSGLVPEFGNLNTPLNQEVTKYYIENTKSEVDIPAFVTAILADYRGFDTFGETFVIFVAGIAVYTILGIKNEKK